MDDLSLRLLKLVSNPNATMDQLTAGMEALTRQIDADNRARRHQQQEAQRVEVQGASIAELRKLAQRNLEKIYRK
jgi:hypothetical protein